MDNREYFPLYPSPFWVTKPLLFFDRLLRLRKHAICQIHEYTPEMFAQGQGWPTHADTMIGIKRLENIEDCIEDVIKNNIPGDLMEAGVWRGGSGILMMAMLKERNIKDRQVWMADSFEGLPRPNPKKYPADKGDKHHLHRELAVSIENVEQNFKKYNLLTEQVKFLKGWFKDTLPAAPIKQLALLRLDGDMYESTLDVLKNLYPKVSPGGYIIIDDYGGLSSCKQAVDDFRKQYAITEAIEVIDWTGIYWKKQI